MNTVKKSNPLKAPAWFLAFEKRNDARFDKIEAKVSNLSKKLDKIVKLNNLKTQ